MSEPRYQEGCPWCGTIAPHPHALTCDRPLGAIPTSSLLDALRLTPEEYYGQCPGCGTEIGKGCAPDCPSPQVCSVCKEPLFGQHKPSCYRHGRVSAASLYGADKPKEGPAGQLAAEHTDVPRSWTDDDPSKPTRAVVFKRSEDGQLVLPQFIHIDARGRHLIPYPVSAERRPRFAKCGLCSDRIPLTDDPIENHHNAMRHKEVCKVSSAQQEAERQKLIAEFQQQPHVIALRRQGVEQELRTFGIIRPRPWWMPTFLERWMVRRQVSRYLRDAAEPLPGQETGK